MVQENLYVFLCPQCYVAESKADFLQCITVVFEHLLSGKLNHVGDSPLEQNSINDFSILTRQYITDSLEGRHLDREVRGDEQLACLRNNQTFTNKFDQIIWHFVKSIG